MSTHEFKVTGWRAAVIWYAIMAVLCLPLEVVAFLLGRAS